MTKTEMEEELVRLKDSHKRAMECVYNTSSALMVAMDKEKDEKLWNLIKNLRAENNELYAENRELFRENRDLQEKVITLQNRDAAHTEEGEVLEQ